MKILLTGPIGVGKSTIIDKVVKTMNIKKTGFYTKPVIINNAVIGYKMYDYQRRISPFWIGIKDSPLSCRPITANFDEYGSRIIENLQNTSMVILDEIGFLERNAKIYQDKLTDLLDSDTNILGVIKPKNNPFLNDIKNRPDIILVEVTVENRNWTPFFIIQIFNAQKKPYRL